MSINQTIEIPIDKTPAKDSESTKLAMVNGVNSVEEGNKLLKFGVDYIKEHYASIKKGHGYNPQN